MAKTGPKLKDGAPRTIQIGVRVTPSLMEKLTALSESNGMSVCDILRKLAVEEAARHALNCTGTDQPLPAEAACDLHTPSGPLQLGSPEASPASPPF